MSGGSLPKCGEPLALFVGEGEMAARIRAMDWSATPVGPILGWPQCLCTAVSIMLESRHPMLIWWGPEFTMFYNDAFMALAGSKHPSGLGQRGSEMFADIWPTIGPMLNGVLSSGQATWVDDQLLIMNRRGLEEETYWTYSYSPIRDIDARVGGVFTATTDTTTRVLGERRLRTLRELGEIATVEVATAEDACAAALRVLARNRADVPYALAYVLDDDATSAGLVGSFGLRAASPTVPTLLPHPRYGTQTWEVASTGRAALSSGVSPGAFLGGDGTIGEVAPKTAVALPLTAGGRPAGVLVAGVSPYRSLDEDYRSFFDLVAGQVSTVIADVWAYQEQRRRAEALAQLDRAKTEFFANVSHEFRTPLTLIMGPLAELCAAPAVTADARSRENLDVVHRNGLRLAKLVNNLLDFSRIQSGRLEAAYEPVDLAAFTLELASVFRAAIERAGVGYELDCSSLEEVVYLDRGMWEKIVLNLLSNALKFTVEGCITVSLRGEDNSAVLRVTDTGTGIAIAELPRLFERFYRGDHAQARSTEGSGIGLALVRELVGLHGGTITVGSTIDVGTTFTVALPFGCAHLPSEWLRAETIDPAPSVQSESFVVEALRWLPVVDTDPGGGASAGSPDPAGGRVLVADDNADMREYLQRLLSPRYRVQVVGDGLAALAAARAQPPDLISDVSGVLTAGLAELAANWAVRHATILTWDPTGRVSAPDAGMPWAALSPAARASINQIRATGRPYCQLGDRSVDPPRLTAAGAPVSFGTQVSVVWLELDPGQHFGDDDTALLSDLAGHLGQALIKARLFDEQSTTSLTLQRAILGPTVLPGGFAVRYEPAVSHLAVGGDWYDIVELGEGRVGVAVGDCVGHGLGAAAVMGQLRTACRTLLLEDHTAPQVLTAMDQVAALIPDAGCTTVFCATIDRATGAIRYSCAGHSPAIVARADGRTELLDGARSVPLATVDVARPEAITILAPGDTVLLYTDGLVERRRQSLDTGIGCARDLLAQTHHLAPAAIAERLAEGLLGTGHDDDVAYLLYQHPLNTGATVTTTVTANPEQLSPLRRMLHQWLVAAGVDQDTVHELVLAVGEAASNAVEHAYLHRDPGIIELTLSHLPGELHLEIRDQGRWRTSPPPGSRGRGITMMEQLTNAVTVDSDDHGTTVRLRKRLPR